MKKIISTIYVFLAAGIVLSAETVNRESAQKTAEEFFGGSTVTLAWSGEQTKSASMSDPAYYAFNKPSGGWVIIAGDNCSEPVLAYSVRGSFDADKLPANFVAWMNGISRNISSVRKAKLSPKASIKAKWQGVGMTKASEKLLETAEWGQEDPYYKYCPSKCPTGCVATAMAIVTRYMKYPDEGKGTIPAYTTETNKKKISAIDIDGYSYNWNNMPLSYGSSATSTQKEAVARLMQHCGAMVQMDYTTDGSGAYSADIIPAMAEYFGYSKAACELARNAYSNNDWFKMIKKEIDADRPLIYGGSDGSSADSGGHQFVLDGYNSDNMVHINWGWDGECNAWYAINYLGDTSDIQGVFSYFDTGIFGLAPDPDGTSSTNVELSLESESSESLYGLSLASGTIAKGSTFRLNVGYICNYNWYTKYSGSFKIGLYSIDGTLKEYVSGETSISVDCADDEGYPGYTSKKNVSCTVSGDIALGDYLSAAYKLSDGTWMPMGAYNSDEYTDEEYHTIGKLGALDIAMLIVPSSPKAGELIYFDVIGSHKLPGAIKWYWDGSQNTKRYVKPTSGKHTLKAVITYTDSSTETVQKVLNVQ